MLEELLGHGRSGAECDARRIPIQAADIAAPARRDGQVTSQVLNSASA